MSIGRQIGVTLVAGVAGGLVVLGMGGRVLMALLTPTTEEPARFTVVGTLQVVGAGAAWGALTGPVLLVLRSTSRRASGVILGVVALLSAFSVVFSLAGFDGGIVAPPKFIVGAAILFPALFVAHGVSVVWFVGLLERRSKRGSDAS